MFHLATTRCCVSVNRPTTCCGCLRLTTTSCVHKLRPFSHGRHCLTARRERYQYLQSPRGPWRKSPFRRFKTSSQFETHSCRLSGNTDEPYHVGLRTNPSDVTFRSRRAVESPARRCCSLDFFRASAAMHDLIELVVANERTSFEALVTVCACTVELCGET